MQRGRPAKVTKFASEAYWSLAKGSRSYHELLAALQSHAARHIRLNFRNATHDSLIQSLSSNAVISAFYRSTKIIIIIFYSLNGENTVWSTIVFGYRRHCDSQSQIPYSHQKKHVKLNRI